VFRHHHKKTQLGFTLIEVVVGIGIFAIILAGVFGSFNVLTRTTRAAREATILSSLSAQYLEVVRNMPYTNIGTENGNPNGVLADSTNPITQTIEGSVYKMYYEVTYMDDPADGTILLGTDSAPDDYKQVKLSIKNQTTSKVTDFLTNVSPKGLEGLNNAGALFLRAIDANGQPVAGANFHIQSLSLTPAIILDRASDATGTWIEVALPASVNGYRITTTKSGYSTDATVAISGGNPNPTKPDATVVNGQVTQVSFAIDLLANLTLKTVDQTCQPISGVNMNLLGAKLIGTTPNVYKYNQNYSSSSGQVALNNIEWDTYTPTLLTGQPYTVYGTSPIQQISVLPAASQTFTLVLGPASTNSILVIVKDSATGTALEGASVHLHKTSSNTDWNAVTGGSIWQQTDWTGGAGQANWTNQTKYSNDDNNIATGGTPTAVRLASAGSTYVGSGTLESSTFDTGAVSNFTTITWQPTSQNASTTLKFQIATNNDNTTWNYKGPDGTAGTYYTVSGTNISTVHDTDRYVRYKAFLSTTDSTFTPVLTSIGINYVAGCFTPGQSIFTNLTAASDYSVDVSLSGYTTKSLSSLNINGNQVITVLLAP
jgi:prepilin-type N-terminal cleavage/methylation domain-containing protein